MGLQKILGAVIVTIGIFSGTASALAATSLVFGVHPFAKAETLERMFAPLLAYLQRETGSTIRFRVAKDYETAKDALVRGEFQLSFLGPSLYATVLDRHPGAVQLLGTVANNGTPTFKAVIIARDGGPVNTFADLKGKRFAFGDRRSALSCYLPAHMLLEAGIFHTIQYKFLGSHENVAKAVSLGLFDAGGIQPALAAKYVGKGIKIIAESESVYEHALVASATVEPNLVKKLQAAVRSLKDPEVLNAMHPGMTGFVVTNSSDYDSLRAIMKQVDAKMPQP
ncbi:MAG TPA: PhnD/SsuA/transferrin family substrate-binding protein [Desulfurivibrionaceae bacterium]|nr:PhnD/SsuA/transferrin family substrate-binding protein [Desulfurivibrionaceae bacterium]